MRGAPRALHQHEAREWRRRLDDAERLDRSARDVSADDPPRQQAFKPLLDVLTHQVFPDVHAEVKAVVEPRGVAAPKVEIDAHGSSYNMPRSMVKRVVV